MMNITIERIIETAKEKGISHAHLARKMGTYRTKLSEWRNKKSTPTENEINICALELGVTVDYLLGITDVPAPQKEKPATDEGGGVDSEISDLLKLYRAASPEMQAAAVGMLEAAEKARAARDAPAKDK